MDLYGSNLAFGSEEAALSDVRRVLPVSRDGARFPLGTGGLLPVSTMRRKGEKVVYAFPVGEGVPPAGAQSAPADPGASETPLAPEPPAVTGPAPRAAIPGADDVLAALGDAVDLVNRMLDQASELARYDFGFVGGIEVGVPGQGWGFTRVEVVPLDAHGRPSPSPLRLHIETCDEPGAPDTFGAVVEYDAHGDPLKLTLTEYGRGGDTCKVAVNVNEKNGKLSVQKVEQFLAYERRTRLLYKRGQPKYEVDGRGPARTGRPGGRGGRGW